MVSESSQEIIPDFNIGEIVKARNRLWRIDQIHKVEKEVENIKKKFIYYSVSNITGQPSSQVLIPDIEKITISFVPKPSPDKVGFPIYQKLLLDAIKLDLIYGTTSFISLQNSKVIPISYQMVPVLMALSLKKVRLLLADDVGLGKTIEAGLILQELLGRKKINRVLFVTPANLREFIREEDKRKRDRLRSKGKVVIELDFTDGKYKNNPSLIEEEVKKEFDYL